MLLISLSLRSFLQLCVNLPSCLITDKDSASISLFHVFSSVEICIIPLTTEGFKTLKLEMDLLKNHTV